ncbi:MAG: phosphate ABC transporter ATP-binding protein [Candidatus Marinimicrobia bacterium]|nr:phosphate ABC transporter ATP-binding protein [Candidatus Neomarinimicrobiota bacterium]
MVELSRKDHAVTHHKSVEISDPAMETLNVTIKYGESIAVNSCSLKFQKNRVTAIIGPSGCGKSTLIRSLNRMNDFIDDFSLTGQVMFAGEDIYNRKADPVEIRRRIGMVFQKPNPFPKSIYKNIIWGPQINGFKGNPDELVEESLINAGLWDEVKDRLNGSAMALSGGQQQRLCIARAIAMKPEIILMDEPASALDPKSTARIEDLIEELRQNYTIVIVTHNMQQAARISDYTAFLYNGDLVEFGVTKHIFTNPDRKETEDYITGRFG